MVEQPNSFAVHRGVRETLAPPSDQRLHVHLPTSSRAGVGAITSRRLSLREVWERQAFARGMTVRELKRRLA